MTQTSRGYRYVADNEGDKPAAVNQALDDINTDVEGIVDGNTTLRLPRLADGVGVPNNTLYYSLTQNTTVYKDNAGTVAPIGGGGDFLALPDIAAPGTTTNRLYSLATGILTWAGKRIALIASSLGNSHVVTTDVSGYLQSEAKGTAFNKAFGSGSTDVATGDHLHDSRYGQLGAVNTFTAANIAQITDAASGLLTNFLTWRRRAASGTPGIGFGLRHLWQLASATVPDRDAASFDVVWEIASDGTRTAVIIISTVTNGGLLTERIRIGGATDTTTALQTLISGNTTNINKLLVLSIVASTSGKPAAFAVIARMKTAQAFSIPAGLTNSQFSADVAATASTVISLKKALAATPTVFTEFGTLTIAAGATTATLAAASSTSFAVGDVLEIVAPGTPDTTLSGLNITLAGTMT